MIKNKDTTKIINIASGQIQSVKKMLEENRYCVDISNQVQATISLLKKVQADLITNHLNSCVKEAIENKNSEHKIEEINKLIKTILNK